MSVILRCAAFLGMPSDVLPILTFVELPNGTAPAAEILHLHQLLAAPGVFLLITVSPETSLIAAAQLAAPMTRELNQACLYHHNARALLKLTPQGVLTATLRAPLSAAEASEAFRQLGQHANYRQQTVLTPVEDGSVVQLTPNGVVVLAAN